MVDPSSPYGVGEVTQYFCEDPAALRAGDKLKLSSVSFLGFHFKFKCKLIKMGRCFSLSYRQNSPKLEAYFP